MKTHNKKAHEKLKLEIIVCDEADVVRTSGELLSVNDFSITNGKTEFKNEDFSETWY
ncbi:MAG: hypothetical protein IJ514_06475 [Clostridia bacterium]|nr:hypothetical protein [Clostridia bacterium]